MSKKAPLMPPVVLLTGAATPPSRGYQCGGDSIRSHGSWPTIVPEWAALQQLAHRRWMRTSRRDIRKGTVAELRSVLPAAGAADLLSRQTALVDVPVALLTSKAYGAEWVRMHDAIAAKYGRSQHHYTDDRHHNIHMVHPDLEAHLLLPGRVTGCCTDGRIPRFAARRYAEFLYRPVSLRSMAGLLQR